MKKSVYRYYKLDFIGLFALQIIVSILSVIGYFYFRVGTGDDWVIPIIGLLYVLCLTAVMLLAANHLTYGIITEDKIESFSLLNRRFCTIDISKPFFYARIREPKCGGYIDALYVSNERFECKKGIFRGEVVKRYVLKKMAMFPYDETLVFLMNSPFAKCVNL